jgi:flagellar basal-body rod modification protein FlgD
MDVASAASAGLQKGGSQTSADAKKATLDYNAFLTLLMAQIKNQDPTQPQDSAQFLAQLATFSSVEQAVKTNAKLDELMTSFALSQADGVIGHTVTSPDGSVKGVAKAIRIVDGGAIAVLDNEQQVQLGAGVTIS